jgi:hypothetical protein
MFIIRLRTHVYMDVFVLWSRRTETFGGDGMYLSPGTCVVDHGNQTVYEKRGVYAM